ncbi:uncharacterized protein [Dermacentor albipictus]|uniref:uncharacterized protein n=1 Tax=Dermacentor albipictus TaxID=60249 RepID=UPI0031FCDCA5
MQERPSSTVVYQSPPPYSPPPSYSRSEMVTEMGSSATSFSVSSPEVSMPGQPWSSTNGLPVHMSRSLSQTQAPRLVPSRTHISRHSNIIIGSSASRLSLPSVAEITPWRVTTVASRRPDNKMARYWAAALAVFGFASLCALAVTVLNMAAPGQSARGGEMDNARKELNLRLQEQTRMLEVFGLELHLDRRKGTKGVTLKRPPFFSITKRRRTRATATAMTYPKTVPGHLDKTYSPLPETTDLIPGGPNAALPHLRSRATASPTNETEVDIRTLAEAASEAENPNDTTWVGRGAASWDFIEANATTDTGARNKSVSFVSKALFEISSAQAEVSASLPTESSMPQKLYTAAPIATETPGVSGWTSPAMSSAPQAYIEVSSLVSELPLSGGDKAPVRGTTAVTTAVFVTQLLAGNNSKRLQANRLHGYNDSDFNLLRSWIRVI